MNADDLYQIVKDVPKEAWPDEIHIITSQPGVNNPTTFIHKKFIQVLDAYHIEPMFIGSMMKIAVARGWDICELPDGKIGVLVKDTICLTADTREGSTWCRAPTTIEALAAACKGTK